VNAVGGSTDGGLNIVAKVWTLTMLFVFVVVVVVVVFVGSGAASDRNGLGGN